jgi:uncharacterized membrane protein
MSFGVFLIVLLSAITHSLWNFFARVIKGDVPVLWIALVMASVGCFPFTLLRGWPVDALAKSLPFMLATGIIHAIYFRLLAWCYEHGEISIVYPIARGSGVAGASLLAYFLMSEQISVCGAAGVVCVCAGTVLAGFGDIRGGRFNVGVGLMAVSVGATISIYSLIDKGGVRLIDPVNYIFALFFLAAVFLTPYVLLRHRSGLIDAVKKRKRYSMLIGCGSIGTYLIILFAFRLEELSYVVAVREFAVVIGAVLGLTLLKERFTLKKILGICAITAGMILIKLA